jgi:hypothetical protein
MPVRLFLYASLPLLLLLGGPHSLYAQTSPANVAAEKWVISKIAKGEEAHLVEAFPNAEDRKLSASFIQKLLTTSVKGLKVGTPGIHIYDAVVSDSIDLQNREIPFLFSLSNCVFENDVLLRNTSIKGDMNFAKSQFKKFADFEDIKVDGDAFFSEVIFASGVSFLGAHVRAFNCVGGCQFTATDKEALFENMQIDMNAIFSKKVEFKGPANFRTMNVGQTIYFGDETRFDDSVSFFNAEIKKDFAAVGVQFRNKAQDPDFFGLKVHGNAIFKNSIFEGGLNLRKADIGGNLELENVRAGNTEKQKALSGLKADGILFDGAQFAPPYWLNAMSYRMISYNMDDEALLSFVGKSEYKPDVYSTLESFYQRTGDVYAARVVYVAWKNRERDAAFSKFPLRGIWMWVQYVTTGYGKFLVRALLWGLLFIIVGCVFFWKESGMETQNVNDAAKYKGRYHPIWYSLATFLPIVKLPDASIWTPREDRKVARFYLRLHIILGYLLIPIGLAAWTGIIK